MNSDIFFERWFSGHRQVRRLAVLFITLQISACGSGQKPAPPVPQVVVAPVLQQTVPIIMQFAGTVKGNRKVVIKPQVSGYIQQRLFTDGTHVEVGDPLYQIDPRPFQAQLDAARAQLEKDRASMSFWNREVKRYEFLAKKDFVSKEKRDSAVAKQKEFIAAVDKDKADIEQSRLDLEYCRIVAPFSGWIQETRVYKGAIVTAQKTELTVLTSLDPVYVDFRISRRDAFTIQELSERGLGPKRRSDITGTITLPDGTEYSDIGHVDYSSADFDPRTDTMAARAIFQNRSMIRDRHFGLGLTLIPGQYVPLNLTVGHRPDALLVLQSSVQQTQQGSFVYVLGSDDKVEKRLLKPGFVYKKYRVIDDGLKAGEKIVVEGLQKIRKPGIKVRPVAAGTLRPGSKVAGAGIADQ